MASLGDFCKRERGGDLIPITPPLPPQTYQQSVEVPGAVFLSTTPNPTRHQWSKHNYWRHIHSPLYTAMNGICCYSASFTPRRQGKGPDHTSVDHFVPKTVDSKLAYDWNNFRLCRAKLNNRKDNFQDVLDPYVISNGWFRINFATFSLEPDSNLKAADANAVVQTINRLGLNSDDQYVNERARAVYAYVENRLSMSELRRFYPFLASEIAAQKFDLNFLGQFRKTLQNPQVRAALQSQGLL